MRRREFIAFVGSTAVVWSFAAHGQSAKPVIGFLRNTTPDESAYLLTDVPALPSRDKNLRREPRYVHLFRFYYVT